jgi:ribonuclease III
MSDDGLDAVASRLGVAFSDRSLLRRALTHPSYSLEQGGEDYERLEFLGDSVLGSVVASRLYADFPELPEGLLSRMKSALTSGRTLADVARSLGLGEALLFGRGAVKEATRDSVLENAFEAVVGAVFLEGGSDAASDFVLRVLGDRLDAAVLLGESLDAKTRMQELTQSKGLGLPSYEIVAQSGPAHDPCFTAVVCISGKVCGTGTGTSKQEAQQAAAASALEVLEAV